MKETHCTDNILMKIIDLNHCENIYPYIFLPEIITNHINEGYSQSEKLSFLNLEKPRECDLIKLSGEYDYYLHDIIHPINIKTVLDLKYDSVNENLEKFSFCLDKYQLPKKPLLHYIEKAEKINYKDGTEFIIRSLLFLPVIGIILFFIIVFFGPIFMTLEEQNQMSVWPYIISGSLTLYLILLVIVIARKDNNIFSKQVVIKRTLMEESKRIQLLDEYKSKINSIVIQYKNDLEKSVFDFENKYKLEEKTAEIGILYNLLFEKNVELIDNRNTKKGKSELFFLDYLIKTFGRKVFTDFSPDVGRNPYQPDFVVFDADINLYIDIEIDEPYSLIDGTTIHHDRTKDEERNRFFNKINWGVIRFTEKQVIQNPEECCLIIENVFESIKSRTNSIHHKLQTEKFWTHEEALIMQVKNYRNSY